MTVKPNLSLRYGLLAIFLWSTVASAFALTLELVSVYQLLCLSSLTSLLALALAMLVTRKWTKLLELRISQWLQLIGLSLLNPILYYICLFSAYDRLKPQIAQSINFSWPLFLALGSTLIGGQGKNRSSLMFMIPSFLGLLLITSQGQSFSGITSNGAGILFAFLSAIIWASYWIISSQINIDALVKLFAVFLVATPILALISWLDAPSAWLNYNPKAILGSLYIGLFEMGLTFFLWLKALEHSNDKVMLSNLSFLSPTLSLIWIQVILGESISLFTWVGFALILCGNGAPQISSSIRRKMTSQS